MKRTRDAYDDESSSSESEEFHQRKIRVNVKLPDERSEDEEDESPHQQLPQRKHFCVICEKQFSSGKAYGGHVRIHSTEYNNKGKMKKKLKMKKKRKIGLVKKDKEKEIDLISTDMEGKIRCCLCGKEFQTMHSLFGHMRRHPDRSWKGIRPPPPPEKFKLNYDDDDDDDEGDDEYDDVMSDVTQDVQEAACILMMISYTSSNYWAGMNKDTESPKEKDKVLGDGGMEDKKGLIVDTKIKMEIEMKVNNPPDEAKSSLGFDLNQPPYHEDHPYSG